jgi:hypothetical protein
MHRYEKIGFSSQSGYSLNISLSAALPARLASVTESK